MKRVIYGMVSSLVILSAAMPVMAQSQSPVVGESRSDIEQMFRQQRVLADEMQTLMAQMKAVMAEMKALTPAKAEKSVTMADLYKQQQILLAKVEGLIGRTRLDTLPVKTSNPVSMQVLYQQQVEMMAEMKAMMTEMKAMMKAFRGRATNL